MRELPVPAQRTVCHVMAFCEHYPLDLQVDPPLRVCSACVEIGDSWAHLRQCLTCGVTACCDLSPNRHATAHHRQTGHPMVRSAEPEETWWWCYLDDRLYPTGSTVAGTAAT